MSDTFEIEALRPSSKGAYRLTVRLGPEDDLEGDLEDLVAAIALHSSESATPSAIRDTIARFSNGRALSLPVLAAKGSEPGECLVVTAGVHGDEYEGMLAIQRVFEALDPESMRGCFVAVPAVTLPAFWLGVRRNPLDGRNMARTFPGSRDGTVTERIAANVLESVLRHADLFIDLHSAGANYHMLTLCGYVAIGAQKTRAREAAEKFGAPFVWEHPDVGPGRTLTSTLELDIPSLYAETYGGGAVRPEDVDCYVRGICNLLQYMKIAELTKARPGPSRPRRLRGSGDLDYSIACSESGLYFATAGLGDKVRRGDLLGEVRDLDGRLVERVSSPGDGVVVLTRANPRVYAGESVAAITGEVEGEDE